MEKGNLGKAKEGRGKRIGRRTGMTGNMITISWESSLVPTPVSYYIYRRAQQDVVVPAIGKWPIGVKQM